MKKRLLGLSLVTVVALLVGWHLLRDIRLSELRAVSPVTSFYLVVLAILNICAYVLAVSILLAGMGYKARVKSVYLVVTAGGTASYVSNVKLGIPARIVLYRKVLGIPTSAGTASIALEIAAWSAAMAVIMLLPANDDLLPDDWWLALGALAGLAGVFALLFLSLPRLNKLYEKEDWLTNRVKGVLTFATDFKKGILSIKKTALIPVTALVALQYLIDAFSVHLILRDLGYEVSVLSLAHIIVVSYFVGIISMMPLGLGTRDVSLTFLIMQLGVPKEVAVSCALIQRTVRLALPFALGLASANILGIKFWKRGVGDNLPGTSSGASSLHD